MADRVAELHRRVVEAPDDADARRVLADALIEAGDPRGELIQLELALAGGLAIRIRDELTRRHTQLVAQHFGAWFPEKLGEIRTRGGFAHAVRGTLRQLIAAGPLFAREPIAEVEAAEVEPDSVATLLAQPWLPRIQRLIVRGPIGDAGLGAIWRAPATRGLVALNVSVTGIGRAPLAAADVADGLPAVASLVLGRNPLRAGWLAALHGWRGLAGLDTLYLPDCGIGPSHVVELTAAPLPALRKLVLSHNRFGNDAAELLAAARVPALRHLELRATGVGLPGVQALVAGLPQLTRLDVRGIGARPDHRAAIRQLAPFVVL